MPVARLLREQTIGEVRWVALDRLDRAVALYLERPHAAGCRPVFGEHVEARVRTLDAALGGAFVDLGARGEAFLRLKPQDAVTEGAQVRVEVAAESRAGKVARVRLVQNAGAGGGAAAWRAALTGGTDAAVETRPAGDADVQAAFDDALASTAVLAGGGRMHFERTQALVAADIDTAGRGLRGGRRAAALAINREAAGMLARQIHLRGWGGLAVLDCVAPVDKAAGAEVRSAFLDAFRDISARSVKALAPSAFGLMEASMDWQLTPLSERMLTPDGRPLPEALALEGLRQLEARARAERMARLTLRLPAAAYGWLERSGLDAGALLAQTYGGRLTIASAGSETLDVKETE